jgi:hypothetical protein
MAGPSFLAPIGEFFLLRRAEERVRRYSPAQYARVAAHREAGGKRARAARRAGDPVSAAVLYRDALLAYARADAAAQGEDAGGELRTADLALRLPLVPMDAVDPSTDDTSRVRRAVAAEDPLFFDTLGREELDRVVAAMDRAVVAARRGIEARSVTHLRGARIGRIAGCVLLLLAVGVHLARAWLRPDIALGKPVKISSFLIGKPELLVDGDIGTSFAVATTRTENPWLSVDLGSPHPIGTIDVYNRVDGYVDDSLPIVIETSLDDAHWTEVGRRDTTFGAYPPWTVHPGRMPARFVRARSLVRTTFALSEIAVYEK